MLLWAIPIAIFFAIAVPYRKYDLAKSSGLSAQWLALSGRQRLTVIIVIAAVIGIIYVSRTITLGERAAILRQQFHFPDDVALEYFNAQTKRRYKPCIEGVVRFDDADYQAYLASLDDSAIWTTVLFDCVGSGNITPADRGSGYTWHSLPYPGWAGDITMRWGSNATGKAQHVKHGRYFCTVVIAKAAATRNAPLRYNATACRSVPRGVDHIEAIVLGVSIPTPSRSTQRSIRPHRQVVPWNAAAVMRQ